jgi:hypothetical protein
LSYLASISVLAMSILLDAFSFADRDAATPIVKMGA